MVLPRLPWLVLELLLVLALSLEEHPEQEHRPLALEQVLEQLMVLALVLVLEPVLALPLEEHPEQELERPLVLAQEQEQQATHQRRRRSPETQQPVEAVSPLAVVLLAELPLLATLPAVRQL